MQVDKAKDAKSKAAITEKINNWFIAQMISMMAGGAAGAVGRFVPLMGK